MRKLFLIVAILIHNPTFAKDNLVIENVTVVSSHLDKPMENMHVSIADGKIESILASKNERTEDADVIDGSGLYLVPGIMDSHVHVSSIPGMGFGVEPIAQKHTDLANFYHQQQPLSFLYYGVTQVVDPNPGRHWQKFTSAHVHPDYFRCEVITSKKTFPLVEKTDELSKSMFPNIVDENVDKQANTSPEKIVERIAASGATCIKLYFEDGYGNASHWPLLSSDTLKRIRVAAKRSSLLIVAHANAIDMYDRAIEANVDVIAHGLWNWNEFSRENELPKPIEKMLDRIIAKNIGYMPTQRVIAGLGELMLENSNQISKFNEVTPKELIDWYKQPTANWFKDELRIGFEGLPDEVIARIFLKDRVSKGAKVMQKLDKADHPILLGSDFPGSPSYANQPGLTSFLEMKAMADAGVPLSNVLAAATINNARQFNIEQDYGTVEPGKVANLLLLTHNPLENVDAWSHIRNIILHGEAFKREDFAANKMANQVLRRTNR